LLVLKRARSLVRVMAEAVYTVPVAVVTGDKVCYVAVEVIRIHAFTSKSKA